MNFLAWLGVPYQSDRSGAGDIQLASYDRNQGKVDTTYVPNRNGGEIDVDWFQTNVDAVNQALFGAVQTNQNFWVYTNTSQELIVRFGSTSGPHARFTGIIKQGRQYKLNISWVGHTGTIVTCRLTDEYGTTTQTFVVDGVFATNVVSLGGRNFGTTLDTRCLIRSIIIKDENGDVVVDSSDPTYSTTQPAKSGDIYLINGQGESNGVGHADSSSTVVPPATKAFQFDPSLPFGFEALSDPAGYGDSEATIGSLWPKLADRYVELTGRTVCVLNSAVGSAAAHAFADLGSGNHYDTGGLRRDQAISDLRICIAYLTHVGYRVQLLAIIDHQGETDMGAIASSTITAAQFKTAKKGFFDAMRTEFGNVEVFLIQSGVHDSYTPAQEEELQDAKSELVTENSYINWGDSAVAQVADLESDGVHAKIATLESYGNNIAGAIHTVSPSPVEFSLI